MVIQAGKGLERSSSPNSCSKHGQLEVRTGCSVLYLDLPWKPLWLEITQLVWAVCSTAWQSPWEECFSWHKSWTHLVLSVPFICCPSAVHNYAKSVCFWWPFSGYSKAAARYPQSFVSARLTKPPSLSLFSQTKLSNSFTVFMAFSWACSAFLTSVSYWEPKAECAVREVIQWAARSRNHPKIGQLAVLLGSRPGPSCPLLSALVAHLWFASGFHGTAPACIVTRCNACFRTCWIA